MIRGTHRLALVAGAVLAVGLIAGCTAGASPSAGSSTAPQPAASGAPSPGEGGRPSWAGNGHGWGNLLPKLGRGFGDGDGGRGSVAGPITIASIAGSTIGLKTADGWTRTISLSSSATITKGGQTIAASDLKVGDEVRIKQDKNADGSYTVTGLVVIVPVIGGSVTKVDASTMTVAQRDGTSKTVTLTSTTTYTRGDAKATKTDVHVGSRVSVAGEAGSGETFTALTVRIAPDQVAGTVDSKTANSLTISQRDGTKVTVSVDASTKYLVRGSDSPSLADIAVGSRVAVVGTRQSDTAFAADVVAAGKAKKDQPKASPEPSAGA